MNIIPPSAYDIYCMYVCIYIYVYMYIFICIYVYMYICIYLYVEAQVLDIAFTNSVRHHPLEVPGTVPWGLAMIANLGQGVHTSSPCCTGEACSLL